MGGSSKVKETGMPKTLIVPGVSVSTAFDVAPPLPARSGVLGAVGVVDDESRGVLGVTTRQELFELYGPATAFSFPEALSALANGVSEVVISPALGGRKAALTLRDADGDDVVQLIARAAGPWATVSACGSGTGGHAMARCATSPSKWCSTARASKRMTGYSSRPATLRISSTPSIATAGSSWRSIRRSVSSCRRSIPTAVAFVDEPATAASRSITRGGAPILVATASTAGARGDSIVVELRRGRATTTLTDASDAAAMRVRTREPDGDSSPAMAVSIVANPGGGVDVEVLSAGAPILARPGLTTVPDLAQALESAGLVVDRAGDVLPAATVGAQPLAPTRTVVVRIESVAERSYEDLLDANAIIGELSIDPDVDIALAESAERSRTPRTLHGPTTPIATYGWTQRRTLLLASTRARSIRRRCSTWSRLRRPMRR